MHVLSKLAHLALALALALAVAALFVACGASSESAPPEAIESHGDAINRCIDCEPCVPDCSGVPCGGADGCGGRCQHGLCPTGTTCGGGGVVNQCGCTPQCSGKACGAADGCGGICAGGTCPWGQACGAAGVPGQCATLPIGQGVECFVFEDGYANMAGPSDALYFPGPNQVCMPDGTPTGTCRKWFGRCRTTDPSHTPVLFSVSDGANINTVGPSDAIYVPGAQVACVPDGTATGACRITFGGARLPDGRPVECHLFEDGYLGKTKFTKGDMFKSGLPEVCFPNGTPYGLCHKWFGQCIVAGCGDGACNNGETPSTCPSDCKCGDGICNGTETCSTCPGDCGSCCGNGVCDHNETCATCQSDCGACPPKTCSGQTAGPDAQNITVGIEDIWGCLLGTQAFFANSLSEAAQCAQAAYPGYIIATSGSLGTYVYHSDPTYGCVSYTFPALSSSKAATCANAHGYAYEGPCP